MSEYIIRDLHSKISVLQDKIDKVKEIADKKTYIYVPELVDYEKIAKEMIKRMNEIKNILNK